MLLKNCELTQSQLLEKFNLAFYEGQNQTIDSANDYFIDYLISNDHDDDDDNNVGANPEFDFNDFVQTFDHHHEQSADYSETTTISTDWSDFDIPPTLQNLDLTDIDLETDTASYLDIDDLDQLPPITSIANFNHNFMRYLPDEGDFGHLIGTLNYCHNYNDEVGCEEPQLGANQVVMKQNDALLSLAEDPLLSSSSLMYHQSRRRGVSESEEENDVTSATMTLTCQWENCYQIYDSQMALVKHIEKCHVEVKRGDEFTCFWANCPRKIKPFNARYKLLIHMRVHSGEKPNKCPFNGCNKAFSRLENLKIHQRSHTGERPYLCQFPTCTKSFSNSSDRAKHQRTHFDTKPYACQVIGCTKKYTDPSSLRKHVKNHTNEEQMLIKHKKTNDELPFNSALVKKFFDPNRQKAIKSEQFREHNYSNHCEEKKKLDSSHIKQDLKNKIKLKKMGL